MKKKIVLILAIPFLLSACEENPPVPPSPPSDIEILEGMKDDLSSFSDVVTLQNYQIEQEDYYGISVNVSEIGTLNLYNDDFIRGEFSQTIDEVSISGIEERGIKDNFVYQIKLFGNEGYKNRYVLDETARNGLLNLGFTAPYITNVLDYAIGILSEDSSGLVLTTNFLDVNLSEDGEHRLEFKLVQYAANGMDEEFSFERNDTILIEEGKITACSGEMLQSLVGGVNYQYQSYDYLYTYGELSDYTEEKLNPDDYPDFPS